MLKLDDPAWQEAYNRANPTEWVPSTGFIQWKGTDVCVDLICKCGNKEHYDGYFLYNWKCSECNQIYSLDPIVRMVPISEDDAKLLGGYKE